MKKTISVLLALVMLISMLPIGAVNAAAEDTGVYVGGIAMRNGTYLPVGAVNCGTSKPATGYAYYEDGVLTLHNYSYSGRGYLYDSSYYTSIFSEYDLEIRLEGSNTLTQSAADSDAINVSDDLRITGDGSLTITAPYYGIFARNNLTIDDGNFTITADYFALASYSGTVTINGGSLDIVSLNTKSDSAYFALFSRLSRITFAPTLEVTASVEPNGEFVPYVASQNNSYDHIISKVRTVNEVTLSVTAPVAGQTPDFSVRLPQNAKYSHYLTDYHKESFWIDRTAGVGLTESDTFIGEHEYLVSVVINAEENYAFPQDVFVNVAMDGVSELLVTHISKSCIKVSFVLTADGEPTYTLSGILSGITDGDEIRIQLYDIGAPEPAYEIIVDENGGYSISDIIPGSYTLFAVNQNYETYCETVFLTEGNVYQDIVMTAKPQSYMVYFFIENELLDQQEIAAGETATEIEAPYIEGMRFTGWYFEGERFDFSTPINAEVVLSAGYTDEGYYNVFFCFGSTPIASQEVTEGECAVEPEPPAQEGKTFLGWYLGDELYDFSTPVTEDIYLTARFEASDEDESTYTLSGILSGITDGDEIRIQLYDIGAPEPAYEIIVDENGSYSISDIIPGSYTLFAVNQNYETYCETVFLTEGNVYQDIVMIAKPQSYMVYFFIENELIDQQEIAAGETATEIEAPYIEGMRFTGWYLYGERFDFSTPINEEVVLSAGYTDEGYYNVFFCFGSTPIASQEIAEGECAVKPEDPAQEGKEFLGWYLGDELYDFSTPVTEDIYLTARFEDITVGYPVRGVISDVADGVNVWIYLCESGMNISSYETMATGSGRYYFPSIADGTYDIKAIADGYEEYVGEIVVDGGEVVHNIRMCQNVLYYTVYLCFGDTPIASQDVLAGECAVKPDDPAMDCMVFMGWYLGDELYDFSAPVTEDIYITARFEGEHTYDDANDPDCNVCGAEREIAQGLLGDVNNSGEVDMSDVVALMKMIAAGKLDDSVMPLADINQNGSVDMTDVVALMQRISR